MTTFQNCEHAIGIWPPHVPTTTLQERQEWSNLHAECNVCGIAPTYYEEPNYRGGVAHGWRCPIHGKENLYIDWTWIDSLFGIDHLDLFAVPVEP